MIDRKNSAGQAGYSKALTVTAIAICAVLVMGAAAALVPTGSKPEVPAASTTTYDGSVGYLPAQVVNQAKEIEPMPDTF